ncbi:MAG TPA: hypothetical protein VHZ81_10170 [Galbitalea sp.]|nr:hypothetical protein [Galbitalea sp.]
MSWARGCDESRAQKWCASPSPSSHPSPQRADSYIVALGLIGSAALISEGAATDWAAVYALRVPGADTAVTSLVYTSFFAAMALARLLGDAVRARFGSARSIAASGAVAALGYGLVLLSGFLEGFGWIRPLASAIVGWSVPP